jgi:aldehyde dehydrogenase (NAD+)
MLLPIMAAFAAGNAVVAKPSELSTATSGLIARHLPRYLDDGAFAIVEGGPEVATALLEERFDHIFFTGSTHVGRIVMEAAAKNLTPVTLELGGKSPCYVADDVDIQIAANRIAWGKGVNAGQTCIAPDYVLVSEGRKAALVDAIAAAWDSFYGADHSATSDFSRIVSDRQHQRLVGLLEGQNVVFGGENDRDTRYMAPTIVVDPDLDSDIMTEEIFGPILPVLSVADVDDAIRFINARPKPLALYIFSDDDDLIQKMLDRTSSGGACVNHTLYHFSPPELSFGGVGASGIGLYHGQSGFDSFSNLRGVLRKSSRFENTLGYPPYTSIKERIIRRLM